MKTPSDDLDKPWGKDCPPGASLPNPIYRSLRPHSAWERLACGGLDKSGKQRDHEDYRAPTYSLVWIVRGRGTYIDADGRQFALSSGWCFHRWPGRRHTTVLDPQVPWQELWVDVGPSLHAALADTGILRAAPLVWKVQKIPVPEILALHAALSEASEDALPRCYSQAVSLLTSARHDGLAVADSDPLAEACRLLAAESLGRGDLRSWCRHQGLDYHRFRRQFREQMGESPGQYRIRRRLDRACALLRSEPDQRIADIAETLGYHSPYEFSAQFKAHFGMPPSTFRNG